MSSSSYPLPIVFFDPDSDEARLALAQALQDLPQGVITAGLIIKVEKTPEGYEKLVNWELTAPETLKALALILPPADSEGTTHEKE